jgi:hypoxanthine phosphoribosyltransferase
MSDKTPEMLFSADQIARRVEEIGAEVTQTFAGHQVCAVGLMKSCMVFMADLIRHIPLDVTCHFLRASSFREGAGQSVRTDIIYSTEIPYEGRHILLIDDIVDTGITLNFLLDHIRERQPRSLKVCSLIDKPGVRKIDVHPDWAAFTMTEPPDAYLVGYGLDHEEHYRGLPYIGTIPRPTPQTDGRKISIQAGH